MISPCCGSSLQQGTKFLAMLSMTMCVGGIAVSSIMLFIYLFSKPKNKDLDYDLENEEPTSMVMKLLFMLIGFIFNLFLAILLFIGAEQKNLRLCQVWFKVTLGLFLLDIIYTSVAVYMDLMWIGDYVINGSEMIFTMYELWVVFALSAEIRGEKEMIGGCPTISTTV